MVSSHVNVRFKWYLSCLWIVIYPYSTCKHISVGKHSQLSSLVLSFFFSLFSSNFTYQSNCAKLTNMNKSAFFFCRLSVKAFRFQCYLFEYLHKIVYFYLISHCTQQRPLISHNNVLTHTRKS